MNISRDKIYEAREAGYSDEDIANYLTSKGYGQQIQEAKSHGYSLDEIVDEISGVKDSFFDRIQQGANDLFLSTAQMGNYIGQKVGIGDIQFGSDGIKYVSPKQLIDQQSIIEDAIKLNQMDKGKTSLLDDFIIAAGNATSWVGGGAPTSIGRGLASATGYELGTPQEEFDIGDKMKETAIAGATGAIAGPIVEKVASPMVKYASKIPGAIPKAGYKYVVAPAIAPFSNKHAEPRVRKSLIDQVPEYQDALKNMNNDFISDLTPAQKSGSENLMSIENKVFNDSSVYRNKLTEMKENASNQLNNAFNDLGGGSPSATRDFIDNRRSNVLDKVNQSVLKTKDKAIDSTSKVTPNQGMSQSSNVVRDELEKSLTQAKGRERNLWSIVPEEIKIDTSLTKQKLKQLIKDTPVAQSDDIPSGLINSVLNKGKSKDINTKLLDSSGNPIIKKTDDIKSQSIKEMQGLRSKLLETARNETANGNYNKARIHNEIADVILEDMGAQINNIQGEAGQSLRNALDFSRDVAQKYRQGITGKIMGTDSVGGDKIASELTLDKAIGTGGTKGAVAIKQLQNAADTDELKEGISEYILNKFESKVIKDGIVDSKAANKFLKDNVDILDQYPQLRDNINYAIKDSNSFTNKKVRADNINKNLFSKLQSKTAEYLDAPVGDEFKRVISSKDPVKLINELKKQTLKDKSGEAFKGLKTSALDYLKDKSQMNGTKLIQLLNDKKTSSVINQLLNKEEVTRLNQIAKEFKLLEGSNRTSKKLITDFPNRVLRMFVTMQGAKSGAKFGAGTSGSSLKTASAGSKFFDEILNKLTVDKGEELLMQAVVDDDLMKTLLMDVKAPLAEKRFRDWLSKNKEIANVLFSTQSGQKVIEEEKELKEEIVNDKPKESKKRNNSLAARIAEELKKNDE